MRSTLSECPSCKAAVSREAVECSKCGQPIPRGSVSVLKYYLRLGFLGRPGVERTISITAGLGLLTALAVLLLARH
jgi:hypothetical protein